MPTRTRSTLLAATTVLVLAACGSGDESAEPAQDTEQEQRCASFDADCEEVLPENTVEARGILFRPDALTVPAGTEVRFVNQDAVDHTVTAGTKDAPDPDLFDLELAEQGSEATLTLDEPGTYAYFCEIHPSTMTGTIVVR